MGGGFVPVEPVKNLEFSVKSGALPPDVSGAWMRVGPNTPFWPPKKRMHVFDGDGMVHGLRIKDGKAVYGCSYLETPRLKYEREHGEWFLRLGEMTGKAGLAKILSLGPQKTKLSGLREWEQGLANTAIGFTPSGKLWALAETAPPFQFRLEESGAAQSIGYDTFAGTHERPISAHPKVCWRTEEVIFHGREMMKGNFYVGRAAKDGKLIDFAELKVASGFKHDMCISENFIVVIDGTTRTQFKEIVAGKPLWRFMPNEKLRFGVCRRSCKPMKTEDFVWIEAETSGEIVHTLYASDGGSKITIFAPVNSYNAGFEDGILADISYGTMHRIVLDVEKQTVDMQLVPGGEELFTEFPRINDDRVGLTVRYGYSGHQLPPPDFNFVGLLKWDFQENKLAGTIRLPDGVVAGEPVFIPRKGSTGTDGDEGYVGVLLWNYEKEESTFALYDAETFSPTPVVELLSPRRVPLGFHAAWIGEEQFQQQLQKA